MDIRELDELQKKYYGLFNELKEAKPAISSESAYNFMANNIFEQYKIEAELLRLRMAIGSETEKYGVLYRQGRLIPARRRSLRSLFRRKPNEAAMLLENELEKDIQREFDERAKELWGYAEEEEEASEEETETLGEELSEAPSEEQTREQLEEEEREKLKEPSDLMLREPKDLLLGEGDGT